MSAERRREQKMLPYGACTPEGQGRLIEGSTSPLLKHKNERKKERMKRNGPTGSMLVRIRALFLPSFPVSELASHVSLCLRVKTMICLRFFLPSFLPSMYLPPMSLSLSLSLSLCVCVCVCPPLLFSSVCTLFLFYFCSPPSYTNGMRFFRASIMSSTCLYSSRLHVGGIPSRLYVSAKGKETFKQISLSRRASTGHP